MTLDYIRSQTNIELYEKNDQILKNIFDGTYQYLIRFFKKVFFDFNENTCTVIVARRCLLTALQFLDHFAKTIEEGDLCYKEYKIEKGETIVIKKGNISNYVISDRLVTPKIFKEVDSVVIVDDILIHGRQVKKITDDVRNIERQLSKKYHIVKKVYMCNHPNLCDGSDEMDCYFNVIHSSWVLLSHKFVEMITKLNMPYVSYLNSYVKTKISEEENRNFINLLHDSNLNYESMQSDAWRESYIISLSSKNDYNHAINNDCFKENVFAAVIRYYYNKWLDTVTVIPYVILQKIDLKKLRNFSDGYFKIFLKQESIIVIENYVNELFGMNIESLDAKILDSRDKFLYYLLSSIVSFSFGKWFCNEYISRNYSNSGDSFFQTGWDKDYNNILSMTFGERLRNIIINEDSYVEYNFAGLVLENNIKQKNIKCLEGYLKRKWYEDELNALVGESKSEGKSLNKIIDNCGMFSFVKQVVETCDRGEAHIDADLQNGCMESILSVGELGYKFVRTDINLKENIRDMSVDYKYLID